MIPQTELNKRLILEHYEATTNRFQPELIDLQVHPEFIDHSSPPSSGFGPEMVKAHIRRVHDVFPDLQVTVLHMVAEGDFVSVHGSWQGTQTGDYMGLPATGKKIQFEGMVLWRLQNGQIRERWGIVDGLRLLAQIKGS